MVVVIVVAVAVVVVVVVEGLMSPVQKSVIYILTFHTRHTIKPFIRDHR
jgi:hypothetical protein